MNQIASQDQRTKFMVDEGQIATYNSSKDLNNHKQKTLYYYFVNT
ncbi:hypothetical protein [Borreliella americana]|nr:hypothetical protein [Borreliella americana]